MRIMKLIFLARLNEHGYVNVQRGLLLMILHYTSSIIILTTNTNKHSINMFNTVTINSTWNGFKPTIV
jgi:hypothetical protein